MNYAELLEDIDAMPPERRRIMKRLAQTVGLGGDINERYACMLDAANSSDEFFDLLYGNAAACMDYAWVAVAHAFHPTEWFNRFTYEKAELNVPLESGCIVLRSTTGNRDIVIPVPGGYETADVYLFEDGQINEAALVNAATCMGSYRIGDVQIAGQFSVGLDGNRVALIHWILGADGFRISEKVKVRIG